jgi:hypothetical protein
MQYRVGLSEDFDKYPVQGHLKSCGAVVARREYPRALRHQHLLTYVSGSYINHVTVTCMTHI